MEDAANEVDREDGARNGDYRDSSEMYRKYGKNSAGFENGNCLIFTMSPLMSKIAAEADFMQFDITYDVTREYRQCSCIQRHYHGVDGHWAIQGRQTKQ